jgi:hypothetical protein
MIHFPRPLTLKKADFESYEERRRLLSMAVTGIASATAADVVPMQPAAVERDAIHPFRIDCADEELVETNRGAVD